MPMGLGRVLRCISCGFLCLGAIAVIPGQTIAQTDMDIVRLIAGGQLDEASALYQTLNPSDLDWRFFDARVAKAEERYTAATEAFREVLRRDPTYLPAKRELAHTLFLAGEYSASAHHFRELLRHDPDTEQRRGYVHFLEQIDRARPFSLTGTFAIVSSSNINRGSAHGTFHPSVPGNPSFEITSRAEAGTGVDLGLSGRLQWHSITTDRWAFDWGISMRQFRNRDHDRYVLSTGLSHRRTTEQVRWSVGPTFRRIWSPEDDHRTVLGISGTREQRLDERRSLFFAASADDTRFDEGREGDGPFYWAQAGIASQQLGGVLSVGGRVSFHRPETPHQQYDGQAIFAHFSRGWAGGLQAGLGIEIGKREYGADFPLAGAERDDRYHQLSISAQHDALRSGHFTPTVHCVLGSTSSNIAFYDHDIRECRYTFARRF